MDPAASESSFHPLSPPLRSYAPPSGVGAHGAPGSSTVTAQGDHSSNSAGTKQPERYPQPDYSVPVGYPQSPYPPTGYTAAGNHGHQPPPLPPPPQFPPSPFSPKYTVPGQSFQTEPPPFVAVDINPGQERNRDGCGKVLESSCNVSGASSHASLNGLSILAIGDS